MSTAIKMKSDGKGKSKKASAKISQSIPAHFYRNYIPPKTPKINPVQQPLSALPVIGALPEVSSNVKHRATSHSLITQSMPVGGGGGLMGPSSSSIMKTPSHPRIEEEESDNDEHKEPNSLEQKTKRLTVGSFTCFDVMSSPLQHLVEAPDTKDATSTTSQQTTSTFASGNFEDDNEVAPEDDLEEEDGEGGGFDMEL